jgi:ribonuclease T2
MKIFSWAAAFVLAHSGAALAQVAMQGEFTASSACPALQSIKKGGNPGNVSVEQGKSYTLLGKNKDQASHYWIEIPGASPSRRWVKVECGSASGTAAAAPQGSGAAVETDAGTVKSKRKPKGPKGGVPFYAFAISWEPAFCETMKDKAECKVETPQSYEANHFSLHGLWPQPRRNVFCGVDAATAALDDTHQWERLPEPDLTPATKAALDKVMPGTQSVLERHEWIKHGTCYPGPDAETYFKDEIRLIDDINASPVQAFMAANIGKTIQTADLRGKFDEAYGKGAGARVKVSCGKSGLISEITIGLKGDVTSGASLAELIAAADVADAGCGAGLVNAVN